MLSPLLSSLVLGQQWRGLAAAEATCQASSCDTGLYSIGLNPAGTAYAPLGAGVGYHNRFGLKELSQKSVLMSVPLGRGAASACYSHYGFSLYSQSQAQISYALRLGRGISAGAGISYHQLHVDPSPGNYHAMSGSLGILCRINRRWSAGSWIGNLGNQQFSDADTIIPMSIQAGIRRHFAGGHHASLDVEKSSIRNEIILHGSVLIRLHECMALMLGASSEPLTIGAGLELRIHGFGLQFAARRNEHLGWMPAAAVVWTRNNTKKSDPE